MLKLRLDVELESLDVESFDTTPGDAAGEGTVRANGDVHPTPPEYPCTCWQTCLCKTAYYHCGDGYQTLYSCDYTYNGSCHVTD